MTPLKVLLTIFSLFIVLGLISITYPNDGIKVSETKTLRFPALSDIFPSADSSAAKGDDPEDEIKAMMEATKKKEFAEFADSLRYYEDFFESGKTRFDLPNNDPTWFDRFFLHLQLASMDSSVVHIVHYGDSQLEEDRISSTLREDLQDEFGGSGPGMLPAVLNVPSQTTSHWNSGNLDRYILFGPKDEEATHNRYGPLAQFANVNGSAVIAIKRREDRKKAFPHVGSYKTIKVLTGKRGKPRIKLHYERTFMEVVGMNADGTIKEKRRVKMTEAEPPVIDTSFTKLNVYTWKLPDTTSSIKLYFTGNAEVYAISVDGDRGVAVDNVAMRGSSGTIFHRIDPELLAESYKAMNAKLIIMEYGGNMVPSVSASSIERTKNLVTRQIQAIQKANPNADILFIGPADMARQVDGKWRTYSGLAMTISALREVALENGLAYWDMHRVMGGNGAMMKWVKKEPPLGFTDHIHFTRRGAAHMGDLFCSALRMHYDYFKFRDRHNLTDKKLSAIRTYTGTNITKDLLKKDSSTTKKLQAKAPAKVESAKIPEKDKQVRTTAKEQQVNVPVKEPSKATTKETQYKAPAKETQYKNTAKEQQVRTPAKKIEGEEGTYQKRKKQTGTNNSKKARKKRSSGEKKSYKGTATDKKQTVRQKRSTNKRTTTPATKREKR